MVLDARRGEAKDNGSSQKQIDDPHDDCSHWCGKI